MALKFVGRPRAEDDAAAVRTFRKLKASGLSVRKIAAEIKVSLTTVQKLARVAASRQRFFRAGRPSGAVRRLALLRQSTDSKPSKKLLTGYRHHDYPIQNFRHSNN
jgi:transposase